MPRKFRPGRVSNKRSGKVTRVRPRSMVGEGTKITSLPTDELLARDKPAQDRQYSQKTHGQSGSNTNELQGDYFVFTVETTAPNETFTLPLDSGGTYNFDVGFENSLGAGTFDYTITAYNQAEATFTYPSAGTHTIWIRGTMQGFAFNNDGNGAAGGRLLMRDVLQWGGFEITETSTFWGCTSMTVSATDAPTISSTNLSNTFRNCALITTIPGLALFDTSAVTVFTRSFYGMDLFDQNLNVLDFSATTTIQEMFRLSVAFNNGGVAPDWDWSGVTEINGTFRSCTVMNLDFSAVSLGAVTNLSNAFATCPAFEGYGLETWDISAYSGTSSTFAGASTFPTAQYNAILIAWEAQVEQSGVTINFGSSQYGGSGKVARDVLTGTSTWTITDGGWVGLNIDLQTTLVDPLMNGNPAFVRATQAEVESEYGEFNPLLINNEVRFDGANRGSNLYSTPTEDFTTGWSDTMESHVFGQTDPDGGATAWRLTANNNNDLLRQESSSGGMMGAINTWYLKNIVGDSAEIIINSGTPVSNVVDETWRRVGMFANTAGGRGGVQIGTSGDVIDGWHPHLESIGGHFCPVVNPYVSVGVEADPWYGAGVDGAIYYSDHVRGIMSRPATGDARQTEHVSDTEFSSKAITSSNNKIAHLPENAQDSGFTTPDSVANSITGDMIIMAFLDNRPQLDWNNDRSGTHVIAEKEGSYRFSWESDQLRLTIWESATAKTATSGDIGSTIGNNTWTGFWFRVDLSLASDDATFYWMNASPSVTKAELEDISNWEQLSNPSLSATATAIDDTANSLAIGITPSGGNEYGGMIGRVEIIAGSDVTASPAVTFDPSDWSSGGTWVSGTGETWTIANDAYIRGGKTNKAGTGPRGYRNEGARTNLFTESDDVDDADWTENDVTTSKDNTAMSVGRELADTITMSATTAAHSVSQAVTITSGGSTEFSARVRMGNPSSTQRYVSLRVWRATNDWGVVTFDLFTATKTNDRAGATAGTVNAWDVERLNNGFIEISANITCGAGTAITCSLQLHSTGTPTLSTDGEESYLGVTTDKIHVGHLQCEDDVDFRSSAIRTTTATATRDADDLSYTVAGNVESADGSIAISWTPQTTLHGGDQYIWGSYVDANNYTAILHDGTNFVFRKRIAGVNYDATKVQVLVAGTQYDLVATFSSTTGIQIEVDTVAGTGNANTTALQLGSTFEVGQDGNGGNPAWGWLNGLAHAA